MAVASSPRPSRKLYFENDEIKSDEAKKRYDSGYVIFNFKHQFNPESISHLTYCDALHVIVAVFQSKPLTLKFLGMKKVLELDLEVQDLPQQLQVKAGEVDRLTLRYKLNKICCDGLKIFAILYESTVD